MVYDSLKARLADASDEEREGVLQLAEKLVDPLSPCRVCRSPHRLEINRKLLSPSISNLMVSDEYHFWKGELTNHINRHLMPAVREESVNDIETLYKKAKVGPPPNLPAREVYTWTIEQLL